MNPLLILATTNGLVVCEKDDNGYAITRRSMEGRSITSIAAMPDVCLAGTRDGILRSTDQGQTWQESSAGLSLRHVRWLAFHPGMPAAAFAGSEPAGIFISHDSGASWRLCPEVAKLRDALGWSLPYSPAAGCIRGLAFHGEQGYAAAEVGGVLLSGDGGERWRMSKGSPEQTFPLASGAVHPDVHSIEVHPGSPVLVYAPTGGGFYRSMDGGESWDPRYRCYCRAAWVDPDNPEHILLGPADGVDVNGRIEATRNGGRTWVSASDGLETPWRRHMVERFAQAGDTLLAVLSNGELLRAPISALAWRRILPEAGKVNAVAALA